MVVWSIKKGSASEVVAGTSNLQLETIFDYLEINSSHVIFETPGVERCDTLPLRQNDPISAAPE
jgi:hypothetical protein